MKNVQKAIAEVKGECEKLREATRSLTDDSRQKQSHIEELFKTTEKLEDRKADKQMVENGIKADKCTLESKVSRLQFDSATKQLEVMFNDLLTKVTDQGQDWNNAVERLTTEMQCKLNRMELDSVKEQLEARWKKIHKKLQTQGAPEQQDAAGIRRQLLERFHCLSCDRPVVMHTPGQHLKLPSSGFPSHKSIRPFTVYALEQYRQHYRSLKPGTNHLNYEAAVRRREELQRTHAVMCSQMDSMHGTTRHGDRTSCCTTAGEDLSQTSEWISEGSRSCGGSHTLTSTNQRRTALKTAKHLRQVEVDQSEEVDIIGLDGHIYKGRRNTPARNTETKLPTISTKDGKCKTKDKTLPQKPAASPDVHHPLSGKSPQCSRSTSGSGRDGPVSALGCTSQSSVSPSAAAESSSERHADEPPGL
ncbi:hypothetical protein VZT92_006946 [Zoarces viviparus]|uniref:DUF4795 domain-containing protein n=1 Tax=Zoarces viviparus TaxID=48416 RepID=A0AAW1FIU7_ZOAVI